MTDRQPKLHPAIGYIGKLADLSNRLLLVEAQESLVPGVEPVSLVPRSMDDLASSGSAWKAIGGRPSSLK
jgi:hypothetical protein